MGAIYFEKDFESAKKKCEELNRPVMKAHRYPPESECFCVVDGPDDNFAIMTTTEAYENEFEPIVW